MRMTKNRTSCFLGFGAAVAFAALLEFIDNIIEMDHYWDFAFPVLLLSWVGVIVWVRKQLKGEG